MFLVQLKGSQQSYMTQGQIFRAGEVHTVDDETASLLRRDPDLRVFPLPPTDDADPAPPPTQKRRSRTPRT